MAKKCTRCFGRGFIEETHLKSLQEYPLTMVCPKCKDMKGYSDHIKQKYGNNDDETPQEKINRLIGRNDNE